MSKISKVESVGASIYWFAALTLCLFIFAHIFDDVRHRNENLFLGVIIPFLLAATFMAFWVNRWLWHRFPALTPHRSMPNSTGLSVLIGLLLSLAISTLWGKSPLFDRFYDSCKIILLIVLAGVILGYIHRVGGRFSVLLSVLSSGLAMITSFLALLIFALLFNAPENLLAFTWPVATNYIKDLLVFTWSMATIGIPYAVVVILYDCFQKASTTI